MRSGSGGGAETTKRVPLSKKAELEERDRFRAELESLRGQPYFHGHLPRDVAERCLKEGVDGDFLLRFADKHSTRGFVLELLWAAQVQHFKIAHSRTTNQFYICNTHPAPTIRLLMEEHWNKSIPLFKGRFTLKRPLPRSAWELNPSQVYRGKKIGEGAFGEVWLCKYSKRPRASSGGQDSSLRDVAVKYCKDKSPEGRDQFEREAMFQLRFRHPHIVETVGVVTSGEPMMIVLEYLRRGCLRDYLVQKKNNLAQVTLKTFCLQASAGLEYLETKHVIHRDVATRNCLLGDKNVVKISDFGLAKATDRYKMLQGRLSIKWIAPEALQRGEFSTKSDVWAFGVLMWEVYNWGAEPYQGIDQKEVVRRVTKEGFHPEPPALAPPAIVAIMLSCWAEDPKLRPSFSTLHSRLANASLITSTSSDAVTIMSPLIR